MVIFYVYQIHELLFIHVCAHWEFQRKRQDIHCGRKHLMYIHMYFIWSKALHRQWAIHCKLASCLVPTCNSLICRTTINISHFLFIFVYIFFRLKEDSRSWIVNMRQSKYFFTLHVYQYIQCTCTWTSWCIKVSEQNMF